MRWIRGLATFIWGPLWEITLLSYADVEDRKGHVAPRRLTMKVRGHDYEDATDRARKRVMMVYSEFPGSILSAKKQHA